MFSYKNIKEISVLKYTCLKTYFYFVFEVDFEDFSRKVTDKTKNIASGQSCR